MISAAERILSNMHNSRQASSHKTIQCIETSVMLQLQKIILMSQLFAKIICGFGGIFSGFGGIIRGFGGIIATFLRIKE